MKSNVFATRAVPIGRVGLAGVALLIGALSAPAQSTPPAIPSYRLRILGVYDGETGRPVEGVRVTDVLSGITALTTSTGTASLSFLPDGGSFVRIAKLGYETQTFLAAISSKDTAPITIILIHSAAATLPTVVTTDSGPHYISPALQGFEERRAQGIGHFIAEAELRKNDARTMTDVLERIPGLVMVVGRGDIINVASGRGPPPPGRGTVSGWCYVSIYIDGNRTWDPGSAMTAPPDFSQLNINQYAGIEFYSGSATVPAQFNATGNICGTLLLWTRER